MRNLLLCLALLALAAAATGCSKARAITDPASAVVFSGSADFSRYVALGTSISAGTQSNGLVDLHQKTSFPYLFAHRVGLLDFSYPAVSPAGIPPLLMIQGVTPLGGVVISNAGLPTGVQLNRGQATAYSNMGVPFALLADCAALPGVWDTTYYYAPRFSGDVRPVIFDVVVRHRGTVLAQALSESPTFVTFEYGSNEILGAATSGSPTPVFSAAQFAGVLNATLNVLQAGAPQAKLALFTVPDPTTIPYMTTFKPYTLNDAGVPVALIGPSGPLSPLDLVTLGASDSMIVGTGFPVGSHSYLSGVPGNGRPLPDAMVLSATETATLRGVTDAYNTALRNEAAARGAAVADLNGLLKQVAANGYRFQGTRLTTAFVTGGLFSLDGVHPTDIGQGLIANLLIDAVNQQFGASVPHVDLNQVASTTSSGLPPGAVPGAPPQVSGLQLLLADAPR